MILEAFIYKEKNPTTLNLYPSMLEMFCSSVYIDVLILYVKAER